MVRHYGSTLTKSHTGEETGPWSEVGAGSTSLRFCRHLPSQEYLSSRKSLVSTILEFTVTAMTKYGGKDTISMGQTFPMALGGSGENETQQKL